MVFGFLKRKKKEEEEEERMTFADFKVGDKLLIYYWDGNRAYVTGVEILGFSPSKNYVKVKTDNGEILWFYVYDRYKYRIIEEVVE